MGILKNQIGSVHGLKGETPAKRAGAVAPTGLHAELTDQPQKVDHSTLDLDGQTPAGYKNPETGASI